MNNLTQELKHHFGFVDFRPGQHEAIGHILKKQHTLIVMPTGSGKSLCYQLPALLGAKTTLVVSPLIALMKDQVETLQSSGKAATFINSSLTSAEQRGRLQAIREGKFRLVYVAPERFRNPGFMSAIASIETDLFVVDEAHCISHWGHDFRPDYLNLKHVITRLGHPTVTALTATATLRVQDDIVKQLGLKECQRIVTGFNRPNLSFEVEYTHEEAAKYSFLERTLGGSPERHRRESTIVYCGRRRTAEEVAEYLRVVCKRKTDFYHAGLEAAERSRIQDAFMRNESSAIVATNAFGMGVDKPDIRYVIHFDLPGTLEAYYQEAGRAGRDGNPSRCVLLYAPQDRGLQEWFIENSFPSREDLQLLYAIIKNNTEEGVARVHSGYLQKSTGLYETVVRVGISELIRARALRDLGDQKNMLHFEVKPLHDSILAKNMQRIETHRKHRYQQLWQIIRYAEGNACRRRFILKHFGDTGNPEAQRCCDICLSEPAQNRAQTKPKQDYSEPEKTALIILHAVRHLKRKVGRSRLIDVLTGSRAKVIFEYSWDKTKHYGRLQHFTKPQCLDFVDQLLRNRYLKLVGSDYPTLALTPRGETALRQLAAIPLQFGATQTMASAGAPLNKIGGLSPTLQLTLSLFRQGLSAGEIAERRSLTQATIYSHISDLIRLDFVKVTAVVSVSKVKKIREVIERIGETRLTPIKDELPEEISYEEIRCVVAEVTKKDSKLSKVGRNQVYHHNHY